MELPPFTLYACIFLFAHREVLHTPFVLGPHGLGGQQPSLHLPQGHGTAGSRDLQVSGTNREALAGLVGVETLLSGEDGAVWDSRVEGYTSESAVFLGKVLPLRSDLWRPLASQNLRFPL